MKTKDETKKSKIVGDLVSIVGTVLGLYSLVIISTNIYYILSINNYYIYFIIIAFLLMFLGHKYAIRFIISEKSPKYYIFKTFGFLLALSLILKIILNFIKLQFLFTIFDISTIVSIIPVPFIIGEMLTIYSTDIIESDKKQ